MCDSLVSTTIKKGLVVLPNTQCMAERVYAPESCSITAGSWKLTILTGKKLVEYVGSGIRARSHFEVLLV